MSHSSPKFQFFLKKFQISQLFQQNSKFSSKTYTKHQSRTAQAPAAQLARLRRAEARPEIQKKRNWKVSFTGGLTVHQCLKIGVNNYPDFKKWNFLGLVRKITLWHRNRLVVIFYHFHTISDTFGGQTVQFGAIFIQFSSKYLRFWSF